MLAELRLQALQVRFRGNPLPTLSDVTLGITPGEFLAVVGPSGCGKSTLLRVLAGLLQPTAGSVKARAHHNDGQHEVRYGFVFQHPTLLPWRTATGNLTLTSELGRHNDRQSIPDALQIRAALEQVGLAAGDARKRPAQLSGGMQMRLSLARALIRRPDVLLLDEPFSAVDDLLRLQLQEDVSRIHETTQLTTILVTHNLHEAIFMSDRVLVLGGHPACVTHEFRVPLPRPRTGVLRSGSDYHRAVEQLTRNVFGDLEHARREVSGTPQRIAEDET